MHTSDFENNIAVKFMNNKNHIIVAGNVLERMRVPVHFFFLEQEGYGNSARTLNFFKNKVRGF